MFAESINEKPFIYGVQKTDFLANADGNGCLWEKGVNDR